MICLLRPALPHPTLRGPRCRRLPLCPAVRAPMLFSLSSFALSLLLGFRTNQSIAR